MTAWMTLWTILIVAGGLGMVGLLLGVTSGAVSELKETLAELSGEEAGPETEGAAQADSP
ncbi:MAG: hypothetical protein O2820_12180 [Planctomycetota bacterium]|nr:hypothetical protein [Planctomycetota bacterium]MDA1249969.1 hypothetical protein [Planctomycetota bacterium]